MQSILLSVIIPTFRREHLLRELLVEIARQTRDVPEDVGCEVLVIDNTPEASAQGVAGQAGVRFVHEPRTGVAHVRNSGVAAASGTHIVFIDDDELPEPGWLAVFAAMARAGHRAVFGPVLPRYEAEPPPALRALLDQLFLRDLGRAEAADVSDLRAYLGSGNSMFARSVLAALPEVFDPRFNAGGEDVLLLRRLVEDLRVPLVWAPGARVVEIVPASRLTAAFIGQRLYRNGQLRCRVDAEAGFPAGSLRVLFWMGAGAAQALGYSLLSLIWCGPAPDRALRSALRARSGWGKLLWWRPA